MISVEKAKKIYKDSIEMNIPYDIIIAMEGISEKDYREALGEYLKTLPNEENEITMGWEEPEPDKYICWRGCRIPEWML